MYQKTDANVAKYHASHEHDVGPNFLLENVICLLGNKRGDGKAKCGSQQKTNEKTEIDGGHPVDALLRNQHVADNDEDGQEKNSGENHETDGRTFGIPDNTGVHDVNSDTTGNHQKEAT